MNTILVTGAAGFIGSHVVHRLLRDKFRVIAIDNFNDAYYPKFKHENIKDILKHKNFQLIQGDITDARLIENILKKNNIQTIAHLAGKAGIRPSLENPTLYYDSNIKGTYTLLDAMKRNGMKHIIFASSSSVYGTSKPPFSEDQILETPHSPYALSKLSAEMALYTYHKLYSIDVTILRFFSVFGPSGRPDMAPYLFTKSIVEGAPIQIFGQGNSARDWTYIDDIVDGIMNSLDKPFTYEIINLGGNNPTSLNLFIRSIEKTLRKKAIKKYVPKNSIEMEKTWANNTKAKKLLAWKPKTSFEEGLTKFIDWYLKHRYASSHRQ